MKKRAFTLSEVLLVLGILGVITAVTIPTVTSANQNKKYKALAKKAQSTLQGAIDNKMAYTIQRPNAATYNDRLFEWLVANPEFNWDTIKFVERNGEAITTPDGMVYLAVGGAGDDKSRLKYRGVVYVDLNGSEGPTETTINTAGDLDDVADNDNNFDVIAFNIEEDASVQVTNNKARLYLELEN